MAAELEIPTSLYVLHDYDIWVSDAAAGNHFAKSKQGANNGHKSNNIPQGMTGKGGEASYMMDFI